MPDGPGGTGYSSKLNKFLHSEVNILIQHIIVQDQDGQNNNTKKNPSTSAGFQPTNLGF